MSRAWIVPALIAALIGPLLRQAEAADDLARSLAAVVEPSDIGPSDLGVGDEPDVTPCKVDATPVISLAGPFEVPSQPLSIDARPASLPLLPGAAMDRHPGTAGPPGASARERIAWLQAFLF